ncbi:U3 snoRNP protein [Mortierella sp. AD010]|nr:U3 snoRNP protein [Mortierella sp. AD010]
MELPLVTKNEVGSMVAKLSRESPLARRNFVKDPSVIQFLVERVQTEQIFEEQLFAYIHASKTDKSWRTAAANAMTILVRAGIHFSHQDLRGIQVPGADMSFGVFESAQLQNADLRKTNLQNVWLREANLSNARMDGARFGEWPSLNDVEMSFVFAYTPDGETFVAGTEEGKILLYNPSTWAVVATLEGHDQRVTDIVVSPDGSLIASGADNSDGEMSARMWDLKKEKCLHVLEGHSKWFTGLIFLPDSRRIVTVSHPKSVYLWELEEGTRVHSFEVPGDEVVINSIDCTRDGKILACSYDDSSLRIYDIETTECLHVLKSSSNDSVRIAFSPDGKYLSWTSFKELKMCNVAEGTEIWSIDNTYALSSMVYSPDGRKLACKTTDNTVNLLDPETGKAGVTLRGHLDRITAIDFSPDGSQIATGSYDRTVRLWDSQTGAPGPVFEGHSSAIVLVSFSPDGRQIVSSARSDGAIRVWDNRATNAMNMLPRQPHSDYPEVTFVPGGRYIVSYCLRLLKIWDRESGKSTHCQTDNLNEFYTVISSPCGSHLISAGYSPDVLLWEVETGKCLLSLATTEEYDDDSRTVAFSPDGHRVATSGGSHAVEVMIWDRATGKLEHRLSGHEKPINSILFSPNGGNQLVSSSYDGIIRLWDVSTGNCTATIDEFEDPAAKVVYSLDGSQLFTAHWKECIVYVWDTATGTRLRTIDTGCRIPELFSPDGRLYVACSEDIEESEEKTLQVWDMTKDERMWTLCKIKGQIEHFRWIVSSLALEESSATEVGEERKFEISLAVGNEEGDISFWKLVEQDSTSMEVEMGEVKDTNDKGRAGNIINGKTYKFVLQWTTAYGKPNADGAIIKGVRGLSRANGRLLEQYGALGKPTIGLHHAAAKMMMTKKVVTQFRARQKTKDDQVRDAAVSDKTVREEEDRKHGEANQGVDAEVQRNNNIMTADQIEE